MEKAEIFFAGEMSMRLSWRSGFQWCQWPCGDQPCYQLLWPDKILEVRHYDKRVFVCPFHKTLWDQLQQPLDEIWPSQVTPAQNGIDEERARLVEA